MSEYKLTTEILALSASSDWDAAKMEWQLEDITKEEEPQTCLCGHYPIVELCTLRNRINHNTAIVGNCCVKRFIGLPSEEIFQAVTRVQKDWWRALNKETIYHAYDKRWITEWELTFYLDTMRKRIDSMSGKQSSKRNEINKRVLAHIIRSKPKSGQQGAVMQSSAITSASAPPQW